MGAIAILSHIVIDEVHKPGVPEAESAVGGAGAYAAVGASLAGGAFDSAIVSGAGEQDLGLLTSWCCDREIDSSGLFVVSTHSPRTRIEYFDDGERVESPVYGVDHFDAHTPLPIHIPFDRDRLSGVYLFHDDGADYWRSVAEFGAGSVPVLWEISAASCVPGHREAVLDLVALVNVLSINGTEAASLFGTRADAVSELRALGRTVLLRLGPEGSIVLDQGRAFRVGTPTTTLIDPTGGGNSYSGAFLAAYAASGDPVWSAQLAAAVAATVIAQPGAPLVDDSRRDRVAAIARSVPVSLTEFV